MSVTYTNKKISEAVTTDYCVRKCCMLSTDLYSIYINFLVRESEGGVNVTMCTLINNGSTEEILYADDQILITK
jgi:hypothetical protein